MTTTTQIATTLVKFIALPALTITTSLTFGLRSAAAAPLTGGSCGPQQTQVGTNTGTIKVTCVDLKNTNTGVQNTGSNNGTNKGGTTTTGTGNNTVTGTQIQGNGNTVVGGGNTVQGNN